MPDSPFIGLRFRFRHPQRPAEVAEGVSVGVTAAGDLLMLDRACGEFYQLPLCETTLLDVDELCSRLEVVGALDVGGAEHFGGVAAVLPDALPAEPQGERPDIPALFSPDVPERFRGWCWRVWPQRWGAEAAADPEFVHVPVGASRRDFGCVLCPSVPTAYSYMLVPGTLAPQGERFVPKKPGAFEDDVRTIHILPSDAEEPRLFEAVASSFPAGCHVTLYATPRAADGSRLALPGMRDVPVDITVRAFLREYPTVGMSLWFKVRDAEEREVTTFWLDPPKLPADSPELQAHPNDPDYLCPEAWVAAFPEVQYLDIVSVRMPDGTVLAGCKVLDPSGETRPPAFQAQVPVNASIAAVAQQYPQWAGTTLRISPHVPDRVEREGWEGPYCPTAPNWFVTLPT